MSSSCSDDLSESEINIWAIKKPKMAEIGSKNGLEMKFEAIQTEADSVITAKRQKNLDRRKRRQKQRLAKRSIEGEAGTSVGQTPDVEWAKVKKLLNVNDHMTGEVSHGNIGPKTELEYMVNEAISDGDFDKAEQLSNHLANRQFAVKIDNAFKAKQYLENEEEKKLTKNDKKRKKPYWGFQVKQRWEMKGNM